MMMMIMPGDGPDYMLVQLQEGGVSLTIQQQSGKLDTAIRYAHTRAAHAVQRKFSQYWMKALSAFTIKNLLRYLSGG